MANKNTATITWIKYLNFGSFLQAYGLQQTIKSLGYCNKILSDEIIQPILPSIFIRVKNKIISLITFAINIKARLMYKKRYKDTTELYKRFRDNYIEVDYVPIENIRECDKKYDQFICGSDQIWYPFENDHLEPFFYAGFSNKKKIAYAASFGVSSYPLSRKKEFVNLTSSFVHLSCREKVGCSIVKDLLGKDCSYVLDPTLLLTGEKWRTLASTPQCFSLDEKYILVYFLTPNKWYLDFSRKYAKLHNLKLVSFYLRYQSPRECDEVVTAGPSEFIWLIDHADIVFTDSFHGSIFSLLLHRPFVGFRRFDSRSKGRGQNHRLLDLYHSVGIDDRFIFDKDDCNRVDNLKSIDFDNVESKIQVLRQSSIDFLSKSLKE